MIPKTFRTLPTYSCFIYGEGGRDKNFLQKLVNHSKFKFHCSKWVFQVSNASGGSPYKIVQQCYRESRLTAYSHILCFIDLDKLKHDFPKTWRAEKVRVEQFDKSIEVIWQEDNAEEEYGKVLGQGLSKSHLNALACKEIDRFINTPFYERIVASIQSKEAKLQ